MDDFGNFWRPNGMPMAVFRPKFWKLYERGQDKGDLKMSDSYLSKRLVQRARIRGDEKRTLLGRVDGDW